jgi:hypothetical protein
VVVETCWTKSYHGKTNKNWSAIGGVKCWVKPQEAAGFTIIRRVFNLGSTSCGTQGLYWVWSSMLIMFSLWYLTGMMAPKKWKKIVKTNSDAILQELTNSHLMNESSTMALVSTLNGRPFGW